MLCHPIRRYLYGGGGYFSGVFEPEDVWLMALVKNGGTKVFIDATQVVQKAAEGKRPMS